METVESHSKQDLELQENGTLQEQINLIKTKCRSLKNCLVSAEAVVEDFERKSGEQQSAEAAQEMLMESRERLEAFEKEADEVLENGYIDGFTMEELEQAVEKIKRKVGKETKLVSLVLALAWDRFPMTTE